MKKLLLLRHGEAKPSALGESDYERNLTARVEQEAQHVATYLRTHGLQPDKVYVSGARRTTQTAQLIQRHVPFTHAHLLHNRDIYSANVPILLDILYTTEAAHEVVMVVGHNPTLYELASWLCAPHKVDELLQYGLPTCGLLGFSLDVATWSEAREGSHSMTYIFTP